MKQIYFATTNKNKMQSIATDLVKFNIKVTQKRMEIPEIRSDNICDIAVQKVIYAFKQIKKPIIAHDAGFYVHSIGGFPKTYVNFALKTIGIEGILKLVEGKNRTCEFKDCLAFIDGKLTKPIFFSESITGLLAEKPRGTPKDYFWSDLFYIFVPYNSDKTLAEMTSEEYHKWAAQATVNAYLEQFARWFHNHSIIYHGGLSSGQ